MNLVKKEDKFDHILSDALHGMADNLEVPERVKQKIDEHIAGREDKSIELN